MHRCRNWTLNRGKAMQKKCVVACGRPDSLTCIAWDFVCAAAMLHDSVTRIDRGKPGTVKSEVLRVLNSTKNVQVPTLIIVEQERTTAIFLFELSDVLLCFRLCYLRWWFPCCPPLTSSLLEQCSASLWQVLLCGSSISSSPFFVATSICEQAEPERGRDRMWKVEPNCMAEWHMETNTWHILTILETCKNGFLHLFAHLLDRV